MFISEAEKESIIETLGIMSAQISMLRRDVYDLKLAAGMTKPEKPVNASLKSGWSDETRKKQGERMKQYWADKKTKAAQ